MDGRAKHIDLKVHFIREKVESKELKLLYCPTSQMVADILTKGVPKQTSETLRSKTGLRSIGTGKTLKLFLMCNVVYNI